MTRALFKGGRVFDGIGAPLAEADVVVEAGRILEVGSGLDGDELVDASGLAILPGIFDCHAARSAAAPGRGRCDQGHLRRGALAA